MAAGPDQPGHHLRCSWSTGLVPDAHHALINHVRHQHTGSIAVNQSATLQPPGIKSNNGIADPALGSIGLSWWAPYYSSSFPSTGLQASMCWQQLHDMPVIASPRLARLSRLLGQWYEPQHRILLQYHSAELDNGCRALSGCCRVCLAASATANLSFGAGGVRCADHQPRGSGTHQSNAGPSNRLYMQKPVDLPQPF